jgi:uncharacterized repeat protein (TIGR03943 family)
VVKRWSLVRLVTAAALGAWAALFWTVWLSGRTTLYLSSRTAWLVPLGALLATTAAVGRLVTGRTEAHERLDARTAWRAGILVVPVLVVLALPPTTLGSFAAGRRSAFSAAGLVTPDDFEHGPLTMIHIAAAETNAEDLARLRRRAGESVTLEGFVSREAGMPADELLLTRFVITCCVADATIATVRVVGAPPGAYEDGAWITVTGRVYPLGDRVVVAATSTTGIAAPAEPYLSAV